MKEARKGFTLIELLVVIAIIALLSSVVLASLSVARMKARDAKRISDLNQIKIALEMYFDSNNVYPPLPEGHNTWTIYSFSYDSVRWGQLATHLAPYLSKLPVDPINSNCYPWIDGCYSYSYGNVGNGQVGGGNSVGVHAYDLTARLETPNHPQSCKYNSYSFGYTNSFSWCPYSLQMYEASPM